MTRIRRISTDLAEKDGFHPKKSASIRIIRAIRDAFRLAWHMHRRMRQRQSAYSL